MWRGYYITDYYHRVVSRAYVTLGFVDRKGRRRGRGQERG